MIDETYRQCIAEVRAGIALHDPPRPNKIGLSRLLNFLGQFQIWQKGPGKLATTSGAIAFGTVVGKNLGEELTALLSKAIESLGKLISILL